MTPEELRLAVLTAGLPCKIKGDEVIVQTCTRCGNERWNLELNASKGVFNCWACRAGGRLDVLLAQLTGQPYQIPVDRRERKKAPAPAAVTALGRTVAIAAVPSAARYLAQRGIDVSVAAAYGLQVCVEAGHRLENRIVIPALDFWTAQLVGWVGRTYTGRHPKYLSTLSVAQITGWRAGRQAPCVLVEGHLDGIAVHRAGYSVGVLGGTGTLGVDEWAQRVPASVPIVVMLDGTAVDEATRVYWRIAALRSAVAVARLPGAEDPASLGAAGVREVVEALVIHE